MCRLGTSTTHSPLGLFPRSPFLIHWFPLLDPLSIFSSVDDSNYDYHWPISSSDYSLASSLFAPHFDIAEDATLSLTFSLSTALATISIVV